MNPNGSNVLAHCKGCDLRLLASPGNEPLCSLIVQVEDKFYKPSQPMFIAQLPRGSRVNEAAAAFLTRRYGVEVSSLDVEKAFRAAGQSSHVIDRLLIVNLEEVEIIDGWRVVFQSPDDFLSRSRDATPVPECRTAEENLALNVLRRKCLAEMDAKKSELRTYRSISVAADSEALAKAVAEELCDLRWFAYVRLCLEGALVEIRYRDPEEC